jgi:eukaryotic-like serine/threonine-protein kinase
VPETADPQLQARVAQVIAPAFVVEGEIGRGGNGIVYRARDVRLKRTVAVKLLPPELAYRAEIRTRFLQEAQTAAQLSHPNIVPIYTVDERDGLVYFVMGYIDGESLGGRLRASGPIAATEAKRILREVGQALAYAHARGVIHRDIKPDNILLGTDGRAMVTDFGIARAIDETTGGGTRLTATGMAIGTPAYMSPEQCAGDRTIDGRSDLYSLGVVGYQMLSGLPPFTGSSTPALLIKQISEAPVPLKERRPDVPDQLARVVMVTLAKAPADRFADAAAFVAALDGGPIPNEPPAPAKAGAPPTAAPSTAPGLVAQPLSPPTPLPAAFSDADIARWNAPPVKKFRKRFATYAIVNSVIVVIAILGNSDMLSVTAIWSMLEAYWYARLWADGYDWRDVFKQPRDRFFFDVAAEAIDDARAIFDKKRRAEVRERERVRKLQYRGTEERAILTLPAPAMAPAPAAGAAGASGGGDNAERLKEQARAARRAEKAAARTSERGPAGVGGGGGGDTVSQEAAALVGPEVLSGAHGPTIRRAVADRAAVREIVEKLGPADRALLRDDPVQAVNGLVDRIASLATAIQRLDREIVPEAIPSLDARIVAADAEAASPDRERKLAHLKRQRATLGELADYRNALYSQLENAGLVLQNIRFDLLKLQSAGVQSALDDVTSATQEARALSREIGHVLNVAEELKAI